MPAGEGFGEDFRRVGVLAREELAVPFDEGDFGAKPAERLRQFAAERTRAEDRRPRRAR